MIDPLINTIKDDLFVTEARLLALGIVVAFTFPKLGTARFRSAEKGFNFLACRKRTSVLAVAFLSLAIRIAFLPWVPVPVPGVHDEFSYLLQADTFLHGRLTNPTPALWTHFETFHVIFHPTYASQYPPMQGLVLAAGRLFFGHPWAGVLLSISAMCAGISWMLQGWLPPGWALLGGMLAAIRLGTFSYWGNSYWGGAAAAVGGAFVLGALPRILRRCKTADALFMGVGLAILANSRPFEGFMLALPVAAILGTGLLRKRVQFGPVILRQVAMPLAVCLAITAGSVSFYNWKVTGNPLKFPYQVSFSQYWIAPFFLWQPLNPNPPAYRYKAIEDLHVSTELLPYERAHTASGFLLACRTKILMFYAFYLGPLLALPLIALPWTVRDRRIRPLLWVALVMAAGIVGESWFYPHYAAPATALVYAVILQCMRHLRVWTLRRRPVGLMIVRWIPVACLVMLFSRLNTQAPRMWTWYGDWSGNVKRARMVEDLKKLPGRQLVIVRYSRGHVPEDEWVHNDADIPDSKIIWARDQDEAGNADLVKHFPGRQVWLVEPDQNPVALLPYSSGTELAAASGSR
jgi:hypothetical protein